MVFASPDEGVSQPSPLRLIHFFLLFIAYGFTGWLGLSIPLDASGVTLFWLPGGVALAAFYRWSPQLWPAVFMSALLLHLAHNNGLAAALILATSNTLGPLCALWLLRRTQSHLKLHGRTHAFCLLFFAALGMLVSASISGLILDNRGQSDLHESVRLSVAWWMGDILGLLIATALLANINRAIAARALQRMPELLALVAVSLIAGFLNSPLNPLTSGLGYVMVFTTFICVAWAALSFGIVGGGALALTFSCVAIWSSLNQIGLFSLASPQQSYVAIWIYSACMSILSLAIAAHHDRNSRHPQREKLSRKHDHSMRDLESILHAMPDVLFEIDRAGHIVTFNEKNHLHPLFAHAIFDRSISETRSATSTNSWKNALNEADDWGISHGKSMCLTQDNNELWYEFSIAKLPAARQEDDRFICLARDITKRVHTHRSDLENEQRFRNIFEATRNIAVQGYNRFHEVIFWNKASEELYKFDAANAMGKKLEDLIIPSAMREGVHQAIEDWHEKDQAIPSGELALQDANGNEVWVYSNHVLIDTPDHKEMYCLDIDLGPQRKALLRAEQELIERKQVEDELRRSEQRLESAQLMARIAHWNWNPASDNYHLSSSMTELFALPDDFLNAKMSDFISRFIFPDDRDAVTRALTESLRYHKPLTLDARLEISGKIFWLQIQGDLVEDTEASCIQGTLQDITERKGLDLALTAAAAADAASAPDFFVTILSALSKSVGARYAAISLVNQDDRTTATTHTYLINDQLQANISYSLQKTPCCDALEKNFCFVTSGARQRYPHDALLQTYEIDSYFGVSIKNPNGGIIGILTLMAERPMPISAQIRSLLLIFADRIGGELRRAQDQEKIFNLAFFDPLTGLLNRRMLLDRLKLLTAQSARTQQHGALLFVDIDHFKLLNDTRGHHVGDQLLVQIGERISSIIRTTDLAARLGGDEFVVVFDNLGENAEIAAEEARKRAKELHDLINLPYPLQQSVFHCTISIGVNLFKGQTRSIDDLLRHADVAMYQAKDSGRNAIRFFDPYMQSHLEKRAAIEADLRTAYESKQQLIPYYQVQIDNHGLAVGAELLLRWQHPVKGMISPADFIPVAEQTGLIIAIGRHVIRQACEQLRQWSQHPQFASLSIAVNVSPIQFNHAHFVEEVLSIVNDSNIERRLLKLELTESSLLKNVDQSIEKMQQLQNNGIGFSMDDFGIGYSSLSYLKRLPLDQLKIDQTFVRDIAIDPNDAVIVRTIIAMAQNMNLQVIAEGVETEEQKLFLEQNGCSMFQGYYFGRPMDAAQFEQQLIERKYC